MKFLLVCSEYNAHVLWKLAYGHRLKFRHHCYEMVSCGPMARELEKLITRKNFFKSPSAAYKMQVGNYIPSSCTHSIHAAHSAVLIFVTKCYLLIILFFVCQTVCKFYLILPMANIKNSFVFSPLSHIIIFQIFEDCHHIPPEFVPFFLNHFPQDLISKT